MSRPSVILINGLPGTGSTTVSKLLAAELGLDYVYGGGIFRQMAKDSDESLEQYTADLASDPERERKVDQKLIDRARQGNVIIESRVLAWLLPADTAAFKVWLTCQFDERVQRVTSREATPDARDRIKQREAVDARRYAELYQIDLEDRSVFDMVIDTTKIPATEVAEKILTDFRQA